MANHVDEALQHSLKPALERVKQELGESVLNVSRCLSANFTKQLGFLSLLLEPFAVGVFGIEPRLGFPLDLLDGVVGVVHRHFVHVGVEPLLAGVEL